MTKNGHHQAPVEPSFVQLANEAADALQRLRRLQGDRLSAKAFLKSARKAAGIKRERLGELERLVAQPTVDPEVRRIIRTVGKEIAAGRINHVPREEKMGKFMRIYGNEAVRAGITGIGISANELFCLCVMEAIHKHPDSFGTLDSDEERLAQIETLRAKTDSLYDQLRVTWTCRDVNIADGGYATFKLAAHLSPGSIDWPRLLAEHLCRTAGIPNEQIDMPPVKRHASLTAATEYLA